MDATRWIFALSCVSSAVLLAGLWTPFAALCHALLGSALAIYADSFEWMYLIVALISLSLLMLGPGWWSIDARIYGRRRIDLGRPPRA